MMAAELHISSSSMLAALPRLCTSLLNSISVPNAISVPNYINATNSISVPNYMSAANSTSVPHYSDTANAISVPNPITAAPLVPSNPQSSTHSTSSVGSTVTHLGVHASHGLTRCNCFSTATTHTSNSQHHSKLGCEPTHENHSSHMSQHTLDYATNHLNQQSLQASSPSSSNTSSTSSSRPRGSSTCNKLARETDHLPSTSLVGCPGPMGCIPFLARHAALMPQVSFTLNAWHHGYQHTPSQPFSTQPCRMDSHIMCLHSSAVQSLVTHHPHPWHQPSTITAHPSCSSSKNEYDISFGTNIPRYLHRQLHSWLKPPSSSTHNGDIIFGTKVPGTVHRQLHSCAKPPSSRMHNDDNSFSTTVAGTVHRQLHRWLRPPSKKPTFDEHALHPSVITRLIMEAESVQQLDTTVQAYAEDFNHIHVVTALGRLAKLVDKSSGQEADTTVQMLVDALSSAYLRFIDRYDARNLASGVWACSKLHYCPEDLLLEVMYQLMANGGAKLLEANPQTLATLASSFGQLHFEAREFWSMLAHVVQARVRDFNPQDLAGTAWGFAKAHRYRLNLFELLANYAILKMKEFNAHDMATIAWAFAQVGHIDHQLMTSLAIQAEARMSTFLPHQLSIIFWSYAKLHVPNPSLYHALAQAVKSNIQHFNPQSLANVAWAHARMRIQNPELMRAISKRSLQQKKLDNQAMATLVWAFARLGHADPQLLQKVSEQARSQAEVLTPLDLVNVTWSLAQSGHYDKEYMKAAKVATMIKLPVLSSHHATLLLWSFAKLGHYDIELFQEMCKHTRDKLLLFSAPQLAGILWSLGKVGHNDEDTVAAILKQLIPRLPALSKRDLMSTTLSLSRLGCADTSVWESLAARVADVALGGQLVASEVARLVQSFIGAGYHDPKVYTQLSATAASQFSSRVFGPMESLTVLKALDGLTHEDLAALSLTDLQDECAKCLQEQGLGLREPYRRQAEQALASITAAASQQAQPTDNGVQPSS